MTSSSLEANAAAPGETERRDRGAWGWAVALPPAIATALFASALPSVAAGDSLRLSYEWVPSLGIALAFLLDGLSLTFALLIAGIGTLVALYSSAYLAGHERFGRFMLYLAFFTLAMLGLVLADNLITLFVFWELTTVASFLLIGFDHTAAKARRSALQALLLTGAGGLALLVGLILLAGVTGSYSLSEILGQGDLVREHGLYLPILVLVLLGAFTKSAQVPFHFWLPNAMAAPTPVSAFLHSATMVKAGIYLLARFYPVLGGTEPWTWTLTLFGAITAVTASILALRQTDLKLALAYTTVMALGTLTMFLGSSASVAVAAAVTFLIVHSLYKAALFLVVGILDHQTGTREASQLGGLAKAMPITAVAAALAALSMAGFPPFLGFIGKELKYEGALAIATEPSFVAGAAILANALMVAVAGIVAVRPFHGSLRPTAKRPEEPPFRLWIGPALLAALGLVFGLAPGLISESLVQPAVAAVLGRPEEVKLALWHGVNLPLLLSVLTFGLGLIFYGLHGGLRDLLIELERHVPLTTDRVWDGLLDGLKAFAGWQTRLLQGGLLHRYLLTVFATIALTVGATLALTGAVSLPDAWPQLLVKEWAVLALISVGVALAVTTVSRLAAVCALGVVGVGVALLFLLHGAPDVAITQLLVETLVVVLVAAVMLKLPGATLGPRGPNRRINAVVAIAVGLVVTVTLLAVVQAPIDPSLTEYFERSSVPEAHGRNIVNVILVDFRALDTFGEVVVVAVAALAAVGIFRGRAGRRTP